jgi:hypothetical protein
VLWHDLFHVARDHLKSAKRSLIIAAPFIKVAPLRALLDATPDDVKVEIVTRWLPDEVARGVSDTEILALVQARGGVVWLLDELHAKLFLVDENRALVGSANVTAAGLGLSAKSNFELLTPVTMEPCVSALLIRDLLEHAQRATPEIAEAVEAIAASLVCPEIPPVPDAIDDIIDMPLRWVPRFRSPDRLYDLYSDPSWWASSKPSNDALYDLLKLQIPRELDLASFNSHVRQRLLESPPIRAIDTALSKPQRFGALTDALRKFTPGMNHKERQNYLQIILRWMLYFAPDIYKLDTPKYSEIITKYSLDA